MARFVVKIMHQNDMCYDHDDETSAHNMSAILGSRSFNTFITMRNVGSHNEKRIFPKTSYDSVMVLKVES
jgi:hypothetical protein